MRHLQKVHFFLIRVIIFEKTCSWNFSFYVKECPMGKNSIPRRKSLPMVTSIVAAFDFKKWKRVVVCCLEAFEVSQKPFWSRKKAYDVFDQFARNQRKYYLAWECFPEMLTKRIRRGREITIDPEGDNQAVSCMYRTVLVAISDSWQWRRVQQYGNIVREDT